MANEILDIVNESFQLNATEENFAEALAVKINDLIVNNFNRLIQILYRADINEKKLKNLLAENKHENAGNLIAALFIERQREKIKSRRENRRDQNSFNEEELW